jgi:cytochrome oxidase Cu insertion factor (SCO1/SenC/PrrC family)
MRKMLPVRIIAIAALASSAGIAMLGGTAGAVVKPPVTVTCTGLLGSDTMQIQSGCVGSSSKAKVTTNGIAVPNSGDTGATVYWTNGKTTILTFSYTSITSTCPTYLGVAASLEEQETATVTGGTAGLSKVATAPSNVCIYIAGSQIAVVGDGSFTQ